MAADKRTRKPEAGVNINVKSEGTVLPPGAAPPKVKLDSPEIKVTIEGIDESGHILCTYPDGFVRAHGAKSVEELAPKITSMLRSRYGMNAVEFVSVPQEIKAGETFVIKGVK